MIRTVIERASDWGLARASAVLGVSRATLYRKRATLRFGARVRRHVPPARHLSAAQRAQVLSTLHEPRFADLAPAQVHAMLLREGRYLCSVRTMHRILAAAGESKERRGVRSHRDAKKPELLATAPNQLWSWDITKLLGPVKWTYYYLYTILDVYSRMVVGWMVAHRESATLAKKLINDTLKRENIKRDQLTIHADRGSSMKSKAVALLLSDLGVTKSHSRPHVSNDNPYSESQFKTMKYRPEFPDRFGSIQDARAFCVDFYRWYCNEHHHSGLAMFTPADVHYQRVEALLREQQSTLDAAYAATPERFVRGRPTAKPPPTQVWINKPSPPAVLPQNDTPTLP